MTSRNHNDSPPRIPRGFKPDPFPYHHELELSIDSLTNMGQGVARVDGWVIMVKFALPGEKIRARIFRNNPNFSEADLIEVIEPSPHRVDPICPVFGQCGGCQYQNLEYNEQLAWKTRQVAELLPRMASIEHPVLPAIPSPKLFGYRSKLTPHFEKPRQSRALHIGFLKPSTRSQYVDIKSCPLASDAMNERYKELRTEIQGKASRGEFKKGATLLIREHLDGVTTDAREIIKERVEGIEFSFPAGEFFQNNPSILGAFVRYVGEKASASGARYLIDAYCGSGLFCLTSAKHFEQAAGIEVSEHSVKWARENAKANQLDNVSFQVGHAASIFAEVTFSGDESAVIIDPPRKGSDENFLNQLIAFRPRIVVYVSCNPATQMRDLKTLTAGGYQLDEAQPFDLFPHTKHLECVMTLTRK